MSDERRIYYGQVSIGEIKIGEYENKKKLDILASEWQVMSIGENKVRVLGKVSEWWILYVNQSLCKWMDEHEW